MGLSPSEKQRYNESKRRRKQAYESYETGKIKPIRSGKGAVVLIIAVIIAVISAAVLILTRCFYSGETTGSQVSLKQQVQDDELLLQIVSSRYPLDENEIPELASCAGVKVNTAMSSDLEAMLTAANRKGIILNISSGYISYAEQKKLFDKNLSQVNRDGKYSAVKAEAIASKTVSKPGESEAQLGMLLDFKISDAKTKAFLEREGISYGFILRFPKGKEEFTHRNASASVFRYVGKDNAEKMRTLNMCLEEFADYKATN